MAISATTTPVTSDFQVKPEGAGIFSPIAILRPAKAARGVWPQRASEDPLDLIRGQLWSGEWVGGGNPPF